MSVPRLIASYVCLTALPLLGVYWLVHSGDSATGMAANAVAAPSLAGSSISPAFRLLLQIGIVLFATRIAGSAVKALGQPAVMGEMLAGVALGPSLLGWIAPSASAVLFPRASLGHLEALSQIGLVVFMFLVGVSLDNDALRGHGHVAVLTSHVSIVVPLALGSAVGALLYPAMAGHGVRFTPFALFMGAAMSITAFPVLARILTELGLLRSRMGTIAIACAAVDDVTGWCILAYITVLIRATRSPSSVGVTVAGSLVFAALMLLVLRPLLRKAEARFDRRALPENSLAAVILLLLSSALITELLGIHLLFGAFLAGAVMPKTERVSNYLKDRLEPFCVLLLMPLFFAFTGLRTNLGLIWGPNAWPLFALIVGTAIVGKFGGAAAAARLAGLSWRDAAGVGLLLNTRGLMEIVILNIGLDFGILSPVLFTMMVLMTIVTTFMTAPLLRRLLSLSLEPSHIPYPAEPVRRLPG